MKHATVPGPRPASPSQARPRPSMRGLAATAAALGAVLVLASTAPAQAQRRDASQASAVSMLPVAVLASAPVLLLDGAGLLTVVAVEASADGALWVLERASDGARLSMQLAGGASVTVGQALRVTALASGWLLSAAGEAVAFVPNGVGQALLYQEQVSR